MSEEKFPKITANLLGFNSKRHLEPALKSVLAQDYPSLEVVFIDNGSTDGSEEFVRSNFPEVKVRQTGRNLGFSGGHNFGIRESRAEFVWTLTPDLKLSSDFLSQLFRRISLDEKIAGVQGKLLRPTPDERGKYTIDSTGIFLNSWRRPRDRGQNEKDNGQYNSAGEVWGVNGAAPLYRKAALLDIAIDGEIMDEDLFMYWDDIDLSWRLRARGWKLWYEPKAWGFHGREAGASPGGYKKVFALIKHRRGKIPLYAKKFSLQNNILVLLKNDSGWPFWLGLPKILFRQALIFGYTLIIEPKVLGVLPKMLKRVPVMLKKRKFIAKTRRVPVALVANWFKEEVDIRG